MFVDAKKIKVERVREEFHSFFKCVVLCTFRSAKFKSSQLLFRYGQSNKIPFSHGWKGICKAIQKKRKQKYFKDTWHKATLEHNASEQRKKKEIKNTWLRIMEFICILYITFCVSQNNNPQIFSAFFYYYFLGSRRRFRLKYEICEIHMCTCCYINFF